MHQELADKIKKLRGANASAQVCWGCIAGGKMCGTCLTAPQPRDIMSEKDIAYFQKLVVLGCSPKEVQDAEETAEDCEWGGVGMSAPEPLQPKCVAEVEAALKACPPQPVTWLASDTKKDKKANQEAAKEQKEQEKQAKEQEKQAKKEATARAAAAKKASAAGIAAAKTQLQSTKEAAMPVKVKEEPETDAEDGNAAKKARTSKESATDKSTRQV
jgi:hypothetical protein